MFFLQLLYPKIRETKSAAAGKSPKKAVVIHDNILKISMIILIGVWPRYLTLVTLNNIAMINSDKSWSAIVSIASIAPVDKNASEEFKSKEKKIKNSSK